MICDWCKADSGRYNTNRECCQIRHDADLTLETRRELYREVRSREGKAAADEWADKVKAEMVRIKEIRDGWKNK